MAHDICSEEKIRAEQQAAVARMGLMALSRIEYDELMNQIIRILAETLNLEYAKILELQDGRDVFRLRYGYGWKPGVTGNALVGTERHSQAGYTLLSSEPIIVLDLPNEKRFQGPDLLLDHDVISGMSVIIHSHERTYGVLGVHTTQKRVFTQDDVNFLQAVANVIGETIDHKKAMDSLKRSEERYRLLNEELERRVQERTEQLQLANKELESFSYSVSHDLRAPLRRIGGFVRILLEDRGSLSESQILDYLTRIEKSTDHMKELITDLLTLSRLAQRDLEKMDVNLSAMVRSIATALQKTEPDRVITFHIQDNIHAWGDSHLLRAVLENLVNNAWKFTQKTESAVIEFGYREDSDCAIYFVKDNGAGFDPKYTDKLFEIFQRLHSREEFEGTGVGLAIVKRIIERHQGRVWAEGKPNAGAIFHFQLPPIPPK